MKRRHAEYITAICIVGLAYFAFIAISVSVIYHVVH